jgi:hypothetical protein
MADKITGNGRGFGFVTFQDKNGKSSASSHYFDNFAAYIKYDEIGRGGSIFLIGRDGGS